MLCLCLSDVLYNLLFFFKQKTAYEMRISDWSSDVCSSDLGSLRRKMVAFLLSPRHDHSAFHAQCALHPRLIGFALPPRQYGRVAGQYARAGIREDRKSVV